MALFLGLALIIAGTADDPSGSAGTIVTLREEGNTYAVLVGGELFTRCLHEGRRRPILFPLIGPHGISMTRQFPLVDDVPGESQDHPHHESFWFAHGSVNGIDFWHRGGRIVHEAWVAATRSDDHVVLQAKNRWVDAREETVATDLRTMTFRADERKRVIDFDISVRASHGELVFGDTKEGTFAIRTHPRLRLRGEGAGGSALNSEGISGPAVWGKRAKWVDYFADFGGKTAGIAVLDHPENLRHPTWWHARDYGLVAANPFGVSDFEELEPRGKGRFTLEAGKTLRLRYRIVLHQGDTKEAGIATLYAEFAGKSR